MTLKLVIIGGGSSYTPEIIEGLILRHNTLPLTDVVLVDIEAGKEKLEIIGNLSQRMIQKANKPINVSWTLDRNGALDQADFVCTQIRVGGLEAREKDEKIPLQHGFIGQETNGAGGIFKAFRTVPVLMDLAKDMNRICPKAWLINFTNPAGIVTEALLKHSPHKRIIGVCNIPHNMRHSTAEILGVDPNDVIIEFIGMNHFVFGKTVHVNGIDRTKEVLDKLSNKDFHYSPANIVDLNWSKQFIRALGVLPNPYHQYYFQTSEVLANDLKMLEKNGTRAEVVRQLEQDLFVVYQDQALCKKPAELEERGGAFYSDVACSLMDSIYNDRQDIQTVNTLNQGAITDLPANTVLEMNCIITKDGPKPISIGMLPTSVKGLILHMQAFEELVIKACMTGDYNDAYLAFIMNPLVADEKASKLLLDELLAAHEQDLPQFIS